MESEKDKLYKIIFAAQHGARISSILQAARGLAADTAMRPAQIGPARRAGCH